MKRDPIKTEAKKLFRTKREWHEEGDVCTLKRRLKIPTEHRLLDAMYDLAIEAGAKLHDEKYGTNETTTAFMGGERLPVDDHKLYISKQDLERVRENIKNPPQSTMLRQG